MTTESLPSACRNLNVKWSSRLGPGLASDGKVRTCPANPEQSLASDH